MNETFNERYRNTSVESFDVISVKILKSLFKQKFRGIVVIVSYFSLQ